MTRSTRHQPALQTTLFDDATNMTGFVVADRLVGGQAMGGTRIAVGVSLDEVSELARCMSLKLALAGVPMGGAKGGIVLDPDTSDEIRRQHLEAFGRLASPLLRGGVYLGTDLGCTYEDRALIHRCGKYSVEWQVPAMPCTWDELWKHCRDVTGLGVAHAAAAAADIALSRGRRPRMVIQGFGEVGTAVARHGEALGLETVAVADKHGTVIDEDGLPLAHMFEITDCRGTIDQRRLPAGARLVTEPEAWLEVDADILVLAATGNALTSDNVDRVRPKILVEGANCPTTHDAIEYLTRGNHLLVPDIVANAGGAIGCALALRGAIPSNASPIQAAAWLFDETAWRVRANLREVWQRSRHQGGTLHDIAYALAEDRRDNPTMRRSSYGVHEIAPELVAESRFGAG